LHRYPLAAERPSTLAVPFASDLPGLMQKTRTNCKSAFAWNRFAENSCWNRFAGNGLIDYVKTSVELACAGSYGVR
jgi:hypothetical protein